MFSQYNSTPSGYGGANQAAAIGRAKLNQPSGSQNPFMAGTKPYSSYYDMTKGKGYYDINKKASNFYGSPGGNSSTPTSQSQSGQGSLSSTLGSVFGNASSAFGHGTTTGFPRLGTQINPQPLYSPNQTQLAVNQAASDAFGGADPNYLMKQFTKPGISRDIGTMSMVEPQIAQMHSTARNAATSIPIQDQLANQAHLLTGQGQAAQADLDAFGLQRQRQQAQQGITQQMVSPLLAALMGSYQ